MQVCVIGQPTYQPAPVHSTRPVKARTVGSVAKAKFQGKIVSKRNQVVFRGKILAIAAKNTENSVLQRHVCFEQLRKCITLIDMPREGEGERQTQTAEI